MAALFTGRKPLIGMVHLAPLPGSPGFDGDLAGGVARAVADARALADAGFDGLIVENFCDQPYPVGRGPLERSVAMATVVGEVRRAVSLPLGVNIQFNDDEAELVVARYAGADFIRVEAFVDGVATAGGPVAPCAPSLMRRRAALPGSPVSVVADIHVKEAIPLAAFSLEDSARNATAAGADALIVTGSATGQVTPLDLVERAKSCTSMPVWVGSGLTAATAAEVLAVADGAIIGTATKVGRVATNPVDPAAAAAIVRAVHG
ncbi:MAG: BtpA/SgcQ family protein [Chloroflexota bacterium]|nr:BtpA/SgcQ family protein [Chloroflexota bacterium]